MREKPEAGAPCRSGSLGASEYLASWVLSLGSSVRLYVLAELVVLALQLVLLAEGPAGLGGVALYLVVLYLTVTGVLWREMWCSRV